MEEQRKMKSIWFFVGLTMLVMGVLVISAGIYILVRPPLAHTVLFQKHPDLWWGGIMVVVGILFLTFGEKRK